MAVSHERRIEERAPLTEQEVIRYLDERVEWCAKHWGETNYWTEMARNARKEKLKKWRCGEVVPVYSVEYRERYGNGLGDFEDFLKSDGTVDTYCYGYSD